METYKDKVVLVTGGAMGIGKACVKEFALQGSKVAFCDIAETEGINLQTELTKTQTGSVLFIKCDVTKDEDVKRAVAQTLDTYGRLDCLVNNVAAHPPSKTIDEFSATDFRNLLDLNLVSHFLFSKYSLPALRKSHGNIVNISSLVGSIGQAEAVTYVATKGAINAMTRALAIDESRHGVRVNTISPSNVWTPSWEAVAKRSGNEEVVIEAGKDAQLLGRFCTPAEVGKLVLFLAVDGTYCTGVNIPLSGGAELNYGPKNLMKDTGFGSWKAAKQT